MDHIGYKVVRKHNAEFRSIIADHTKLNFNDRGVLTPRNGDGPFSLFPSKQRASHFINHCFDGEERAFCIIMVKYLPSASKALWYITSGVEYVIEHFASRKIKLSPDEISHIEENFRIFVELLKKGDIDKMRQVNDIGRTCVHMLFMTNDFSYSFGAVIKRTLPYGTILADAIQMEASYYPSSLRDEEGNLIYA